MLQCSFIKIPCNKILITINLIAQYVLCKDYLYVKFSKKSPRGGVTFWPQNALIYMKGTFKRKMICLERG
jgi:hypothetical protein